MSCNRINMIPEYFSVFVGGKNTNVLIFANRCVDLISLFNILMCRFVTIRNTSFYPFTYTIFLQLSVLIHNNFCVVFHRIKSELCTGFTNRLCRYNPHHFRGLNQRLHVFHFEILYHIIKRVFRKSMLEYQLLRREVMSNNHSHQFYLR